MPESTATERDALTARSIPHITLSTGNASSMTGPPPPMPHYLMAEGRAVKRFAVEGNAIRRSSVLTVLRLSSHAHRIGAQLIDIPLVTGGAGTLALVNARALLEHGLAGLALFDLNPSHARTEIDALKADFPDAKILEYQVDVTSEENLAVAMDLVGKEIGIINILCCFAGVVGCTHAVEMTAKEWKRTLDINTTGSFLSAQAVAR